MTVGASRDEACDACGVSLSKPLKCGRCLSAKYCGESQS